MAGLIIGFLYGLPAGLVCSPFLVWQLSRKRVSTVTLLLLTLMLPVALLSSYFLGAIGSMVVSISVLLAASSILSILVHDDPMIVALENGLCEKCLYDRRLSTSELCPECGAASSCHDDVVS